MKEAADEDGLVVYLYPYCHNIPPRDVHYDAKAMKRLRQVGQKAYEEKMAQNGVEKPREAFMKRYGKNWLD